jgi:membrane-associated phospholipid phosphatase
MEPGAPSIALPLDDRPAARGGGWTALTTVDWTPRTYEVTAALFGAVVLFLLRSTPLPPSQALILDLALKGAFAIACVYAVAIAIVGARVAADVRQHGRAGLWTPERALPLLLPYASLDFLVLTVRRTAAVFATVYFFLHLKHVILWINFANYDRFFWDLDRWVHLGVQPNVWMLERLGPYPDVAIALDWLYIKYFDYKVLVSVLFLLELGGRRLSEQFILGYALLWALGGLAYLVMPADGPCYAVLLGASDVPLDGRRWGFPFPVTPDVPATYAQAFTDAKIWTAKNLQHLLWATRWRFVYQERLPDMFYGVAAMPSLHVAAVVLFACFLARLNPWAGLLAVFYAVVIAIGSVFLQWHYAVDGYAGLVLALGTAWLACRLPVALPLRRRR